MTFATVLRSNKSTLLPYEINRWIIINNINAEDERLTAEAKMNSASSKQYTVKTGDSLWFIAASSQINYDPMLWPLIFSDNQSVINEPDLITPDMVLRINMVADSQRLNNAKRHAQTRGSWSVGIRETSDQNYLR